MRVLDVNRSWTATLRAIAHVDGHRQRRRCFIGDNCGLLLKFALVATLVATVNVLATTDGTEQNRRPADFALLHCSGPFSVVPVYVEQHHKAGCGIHPRMGPPALAWGNIGVGLSRLHGRIQQPSPRAIGSFLTSLPVILHQFDSLVREVCNPTLGPCPPTCERP